MICNFAKSDVSSWSKIKVMFHIFVKVFPLLHLTPQNCTLIQEYICFVGLKRPKVVFVDFILKGTAHKNHGLIWYILLMKSLFGGEKKISLVSISESLCCFNFIVKLQKQEPHLF